MSPSASVTMFTPTQADFDSLSPNWDNQACDVSRLLMRDGVLEVVESHDGNAYRAVYTVRFQKAVYVLHAFQKKSPSGIRTTKRDVDLIAERLKTAQRDHEEHYDKQKR